MAGQLGKANSADGRRHYLFVLGNAGAEASLDVIAGHLGDSAADVRAAAAAALRWIDTSKADRLLCEALLGDTDAAVRMEAAAAFSFRTMTSKAFAAQKKAFTDDASTSVRLAVLAESCRKPVRRFPKAGCMLTQCVDRSLGRKCRDRGPPAC